MAAAAASGSRSAACTWAARRAIIVLLLADNRLYLSSSTIIYFIHNCLSIISYYVLLSGDILVKVGGVYVGSALHKARRLLEGSR